MKKIVLLIISIFTVAMLTIHVYAAPKTDDVIKLEQPKSIVFWVEWDVEKPSVVFIAPDGTEYNPDVTRQDTVTVTNEDDLFYTIMNAQAGQWRIRYDKGKNKSIDVSVHDYNQGITIQNFTAEAVDGNRIPVRFKVSGKEGQSYNYRVSAVTSRMGGEKELVSSTAVVGQEIGLQVNLSSLSTYSKYMLKLYVWYDNNGTDIFDLAFSKEFAYTNSTADETKREFELTIMPEESLIVIDWTDRLSWNAEKVLIGIYEDGANEPTLFDEYKASENKVELSYDPSAKKIDVEFTVKSGGVNASPIRKSVSLKDIGIILPEGKSYNSISLPMKYKGFQAQLVSVSVNEYISELLLDGDGDVSITLGDEWNNLEIEYKDAEGVTWLIRKKIFVDRFPPILTMSRPYDGMSVDESKITISGTALDCELLTINGKEVEVSKDGTFSKEISLSYGENVVEVVATDSAGNETLYTANISSGVIGANADKNVEEDAPGNLIETLLKPGNLWIMLIVSIPCILIVAYAWFFWRKKKEAE